MTLAEFWAKVATTFVDETDWRYGQTVFNVLFDCRPELAEQIRATGLDPFYAPVGSPVLTDLVAWLREQWGSGDSDPQEACQPARVSPSNQGGP